MLPIDLSCSQLIPPVGDRRSAVILTGGVAPHHVHFASVVQSQHPGLVRRWFALSDAPSAAVPLAVGPTASSEAAMFEREIERLRPFARDAEPERIPRSEHERRLPELLRRIDPYFLLILGGPLYPAEILAAARGFALNTHAGWSPELKGSATIEQALYHRRTDWIGNTVHVADTSADGGPILRRTTVTAYDDDGIADLFYRAVALGNWLMAEVVEELLTPGSVRAFPQPDRGKTVRLADWDARKAGLVQQDLDRGWLAEALGEERSY